MDPWYRSADESTIHLATELLIPYNLITPISNGGGSRASDPADRSWIVSDEAEKSSRRPLWSVSAKAATTILVKR
jgi:hypothetical protein